MVIQVLNSKLGITIRVSVTSATILTAREPYTKIHKHGLNHGIMTYRCELSRSVSSLLKELVRRLRTMAHKNFKKSQT